MLSSNRHYQSWYYSIPTCEANSLTNGGIFAVAAHVYALLIKVYQVCGKWVGITHTHCTYECIKRIESPNPGLIFFTLFSYQRYRFITCQIAIFASMLIGRFVCFFVCLSALISHHISGTTQEVRKKVKYLIFCNTLMFNMQRPSKLKMSEMLLAICITSSISSDIFVEKVGHTSKFSQRNFFSRNMHYSEDHMRIIHEKVLFMVVTFH